MVDEIEELVQPESEDDEDVQLSVVEASVSTSMLARQAASSVGVSGAGGTRAVTGTPAQSSTPAAPRKRTAVDEVGVKVAKTAKGENIFFSLAIQD